jgi:hypothetical protein
MKSTVSWDITVEVHQRFGVRNRLYLQGRRISQARNQHEAAQHQNLWENEGKDLLFLKPPRRVAVSFTL